MRACVVAGNCHGKYDGVSRHVYTMVQIGCVRVAERCHGVSRHVYTMGADRVRVLGGWDGSRLSNIAQHVGATHLARPLHFTT